MQVQISDRRYRSEPILLAVESSNEKDFVARRIQFRNGCNLTCPQTLPPIVVLLPRRVLHHARGGGDQQQHVGGQRRRRGRSPRNTTAAPLGGTGDAAGTQHGVHGGYLFPTVKVSRHTEKTAAASLFSITIARVSPSTAVGFSRSSAACVRPRRISRPPLTLRHGKLRQTSLCNT